MRSFCRKKTHVHKIPRFSGGGGYFGFGGGGECRFYSYGRADFSELSLKYSISQQTTEQGALSPYPETIASKSLVVNLPEIHAH